MPNYANLEDELLSDQERKMSASSRHPAITELQDEHLLKLISNLETAFASAGERGMAGKLTRADLLNAALRRAKTERRNRGLTARASAARTASSQTKAPAAAKKPAAKESAGAKQRARSVTRKPADRKPSQPRKPDQRTTVHPAVATSRPEDTAQGKPEDKAKKSSGRPEDETIKAAKKAACKAAKKAARQVEKQAEKDARKAAKQAEREARKAARKAINKAERHKSANTDGAGKSGKKSKS